MSGRAWVCIGLGVLVLALLLSALVSQMRWRSEVVDQGYQGEAQRNPFYLAERLLIALEREADSYRLLPPVARLGAADSLLMNTATNTLSDFQTRELLDWVEAGGHLITGVQGQYSAQTASHQDYLLDELGVRVSADGQDQPTVATQLAEQQLGKRIRFSGELRLHSTDERVLFRLSTEQGALLLQFGIGEGLVSLLCDLSMLRNDALPLADHGVFLWDLMGRQDSPGKVWLQYSQQVPSLMAVLVQRAWMPLVGLGVLLAAWVWQRARRFGPVLDSPPLARRSLLEHLRASGRFLHQRRLAVVLIRAARRRCQQRLMRRIADWRQLSNVHQAQRAAALAQLPVEQVRDALHNDQPDDFFTTVKTLNKLAAL